MFSGPVRGGTRGGQGDFKWSDVADDKDRENYLGHSILAPVGRWQKNKDITWYNKDGGAIDEDERLRAKREEIQRIKAAEEDALSAALGFKPAPRDPMSSAPETSSNAIPLGPAREGGGQQDRGSDGKEEIQRRKAEKAARKAERAVKRERKLEEKMAKKSASKSSKYADPVVQRSSRSDRADDRTRDQREPYHRDRDSHHRDHDSHHRDRDSHQRDRDSHHKDRHRDRSPNASGSNRERLTSGRLPDRGRRSSSSECDHSPQESSSTRKYSHRPDDHRHRDSDHHRASKPIPHSTRHPHPLSPPAHDRHQRSVSPNERRRVPRRRSRSPPRRTHRDY
ncbi:hypothetical protein PGT21_034489 [Puccinia graminis f. sp. tritici]|uniref:Multiple myeloma tumor-associated protein 2-like N-terminal domain-containing protein n=1 Tax=Puccinia graminis f. sp. tritici TaxID=56615 RepID=A0A5B0LP00_PUCGR|nr:hypothetical protein PGTUg99_021932 [Puccinia graminis f. sp. tritici]KAA1095007.1 hypothetical protein PGT21_034489 [Puccinia graminis f. sp. tritici]